MSTLLLISEGTGERWQVWPSTAPVPPGCIHEAGSYLFELHGASGGDRAELLIEDRALEALRAPSPDSARWRWRPGFNAGLLEVELRIPGHAPRHIEITTDPDRRKLTRDDFDTMVRDILSDTLALFSLSGFRKGIARGAARRAPSIARLEFLRSRITELESVLAFIARNPRRMLASEGSAVPYHRAARASSEEILRSFRAGRILRETAEPGRLPAPLRGFLPETIRLRQRRSALDIPEHRQMVACLRSWAAWLTDAAGSFQSAVSEDAEMSRQTALWAVRCQRLGRRIVKMVSLPLFAECGDARPVLTLSAVFRRDPAYRRFYRLWQDMNAGISDIFGDFLNLPLARTYELYELWCFLRLVRAGVETFGPSQTDPGELFVRDARDGVTLVAGAVTVAAGNGWKVCFQKRYREFWVEPDGRGSYSRSMVPDVVLSRETAVADAAAQLIVLDAKYRIDDGLNDALSSIHTYCDALVQESDSGEVRGIVSAAYLLSPYLPVTGAGYRSEPMPARLFHPEYRSRFRFGAVTLRPGMTVADITAALRLIVEDAAAGRRAPRWTS